jgi:hypothetical protein
MSLTNFPNGLSSFGVPILGGMFPFTGKYIFVKPSSGLDGNDGSSPDSAVKTLMKALALATANKNDVVFLIQESNTAASTTDYQTSTLDWNKDGVHLIGINPQPLLGHRSRVALISTYDTASNLFTLSANNCFVSGLEFYAGVAGTNPTGCVKVTGQRNRFARCQISGMGHANNVIANAYSLNLSGAAENVFEDCYIGLDTVPRATNVTSEIRIETAATRNAFLNCVVASQIGHATFSPYVYFNGATAIDRWLLFKGCTFMNFATNYGFTQAVAFLHSAVPTQGKVYVQNCLTDSTNWVAAGRNVWISNPAINTAYTGGTGYAS